MPRLHQAVLCRRRLAGGVRVCVWAVERGMAGGTGVEGGGEVVWGSGPSRVTARSGEWMTVNEGLWLVPKWLRRQHTSIVRVLASAPACIRTIDRCHACSGRPSNNTDAFLPASDCQHACCASVRFRTRSVALSMLAFCCKRICVQHHAQHVSGPRLLRWPSRAIRSWVVGEALHCGASFFFSMACMAFVAFGTYGCTQLVHAMPGGAPLQATSILLS